eukprot:SAG31_NODE_25483_length_460_cov_1.052632_1_plen_41_part_10
MVISTDTAEYKAVLKSLDKIIFANGQHDVASASEGGVECLG